MDFAALFKVDLDSLPLGTILVDAQGMAWQKQEFGFGQQQLWFPAGDERPADEHYSPLEPLTVVWRPCP
jgi:hypothetical protein